MMKPSPICKRTYNNHQGIFAKFRWFFLWTIVNLIIFLICYMNYKFQLKHRYLYKMLKDGLSFSRAAAMVINFNLLLVWLPMCKYTLTRMAYFSNESLRKLRLTKRRPTMNESFLANPIKAIVTWLANFWLKLRISTLSNFLIAIDNSTSLHTFCAATITVASVVHTIAHVMNVINFSRNYDPFVSNLNMAEYAGQAPIELLFSVPGITGILMLIILCLMTFSSVTKIRSKSFNLFQVIHRLSVVFVILLFLHPMTHVLKEQINVDRHHPEICDNRTIRFQHQNNDESTSWWQRVETSERDSSHSSRPIDLQNEDGALDSASADNRGADPARLSLSSNGDDASDFDSSEVKISSKLIGQPTTSEHPKREQIAASAPIPSQDQNLQTRANEQPPPANQQQLLGQTKPSLNDAARHEQPTPTANQISSGQNQRQLPLAAANTSSNNISTDHDDRPSSIRGENFSPTGGHQEPARDQRQRQQQQVADDVIPATATRKIIKRAKRSQAAAQVHGSFVVVGSRRQVGGGDFAIENSTNAAANEQAKQQQQQHFGDHRSSKIELMKEEMAAPIEKVESRFVVVEVRATSNEGGQRAATTSPNQTTSNRRTKTIISDDTNATAEQPQSAVENPIDENNRRRQADGGAAKGLPNELADSQNRRSRSASATASSSLCLDRKPLFVAQSSICWLVLAIGLPCYIIDLLLRKWRRSKSSIQLLAFRSDPDGNLIELILSNNHKRFQHWRPGQFIYLNCPQISHHEWHPFTISSMDNRMGRFTLHIKTGGDWTSSLRRKLIFSLIGQQDSQLLAANEPTIQKLGSFFGPKMNNQMVHSSGGGDKPVAFVNDALDDHQNHFVCCQRHQVHGQAAGGGQQQCCATKTIGIEQSSACDLPKTGDAWRCLSARYTNDDHRRHQTIAKSASLLASQLAQRVGPATHESETSQSSIVSTLSSSSSVVSDRREIITGGVAAPPVGDKSNPNSNYLETIVLNRRDSNLFADNCAAGSGCVAGSGSDAISCVYLDRHERSLVVYESYQTVVGENHTIPNPNYDDCYLDRDYSCFNNCGPTTVDGCKSTSGSFKLDLYIDGPFHSPFERLLEQEVSVCIANGVGWTPFSSIFHDLINNLQAGHDDDDSNDWWSKWRNFAISKRTSKSLGVKRLHNNESNASSQQLSNDVEPNHLTHSVAGKPFVACSARQAVFRKPIEAQIHMVIIVPNIEQLKPFFSLALDYFKQFCTNCKIDISHQNNPIREISAYLTRTCQDDIEILNFCTEEDLRLQLDGSCIVVNEAFRIYFGKPCFDSYLARFKTLYQDKRKISIYCCGSNLVKKGVQDVCKSMNRELVKGGHGQYYSYHEENF